MKLLVTGGAGYIGSAFVKEAVKNHEVVVVDNLSKGKKELVDKKAKFFKMDLVEKEKLEELFNKEKFEAVVHFAAYKSVGESMKNPIKYSDNISGTINLLNAMAKENVKKIIFSSTAAVYGIPEKNVADEETKTNPINYYGFTKLKCEELMDWYSKINGIDYMIFRYFNVAGDAGLKYQDPHAENVFPIIMDVLKNKREKFVVERDKKFGGNLIYSNYNDVEKDFVAKKLHPLDLKNAVAREIIILLKNFRENKNLKKLHKAAYS